VLALGVLHRRNRGDQTQRGIYGEEVEVDEFSLDNFRVLVDFAARRAKVDPPRIVARYPFLTGDGPTSLPGFDELRALFRDGALLVATTDAIHHGVGYNTPADRLLDLSAEQTRQAANSSILEQLALLSARRFAQFGQLCDDVHSDFRDVGPVLAELLGPFEVSFHELDLIDYANALQAARPTWVAAALLTLAPAAPGVHPPAWPNMT
jgi:hypothetical protein